MLHANDTRHLGFDREFEVGFELISFQIFLSPQNSIRSIATPASRREVKPMLSTTTFFADAKMPAQSMLNPS
jgi:hypothetical protein